MQLNPDDDWGSPNLEEMSDRQLAYRAYVLGLVCADRRKKGQDQGGAGRALDEMVPIINKRFSSD